MDPSTTASEMIGPIIAAAVLATAFVVLVVWAVLRDQRRKLTAGVEDMIGKTAVVRTTLDPKGAVLAEGELWTAVTEGTRIEAGEEVTITKVEGLRLWVTRKHEEKEGA
jgi:membrane-bound serine protease (ClpP class)